MMHKFLACYAFGALIVFGGVLYRNNLNQLQLIKNNQDPIVYGHGIKFSEDSTYKYRKFHTLEHGMLRRYQMKTTIMSIDEQETETLRKAYDVYFWGGEVFSIKLTSKDQGYTAEDEPDYTEAHLLEYPHEQFFQVIFQDREVVCYSSLLINSVKCIKLFT